MIPNDAIKISSLLLTALGNYLLCLCVISAPLLGLIFTLHPDVTEHLFSLTSLSRPRGREKHGIYHLGEKIVCKKSQVPTKEQEKRQEKSDKLSVTKYQVLNRYFQIDFILTTNLEYRHCYLLYKNVSILI